MIDDVKRGGERGRGKEGERERETSSPGEGISLISSGGVGEFFRDSNWKEGLVSSMLGGEFGCWVSNEI